MMSSTRYKIHPFLPLLKRLCRNKRKGHACHSEPFACHSEQSEESPPLAQRKLGEESDTECHPERSEESRKFLRSAQDRLRLLPQNDITTQPLKGGGGGLEITMQSRDEVIDAEVGKENGRKSNDR